MTLRPLWSLLILSLWLLFLALAPAGTVLGWATSPTLSSPSSAPRPLLDLPAQAALNDSGCSPSTTNQLPLHKCPAIQGPDNGILALYALSLDTSEESDLSSSYQAAMTGLHQASSAVPTTTIVALVDMPGDDNSFIYTFQGGTETEILGLPDPNGILTDALREYDMTDGATLGGFLLWARANYPTTGPTTFTYVGHGGPLLPETDYDAIFSSANPLTQIGSNLPPLPVRVDANPEFTDITPARSLLSVYQLSEALRIGTENGSAPFAVVDLVKCLSGTIEELYPLSPYATTFTTSPSYTYFAPEMLGAGVAALNPAMSPQELATTLIDTYNNVIEDYDQDDNVHPRLLVAIESALLPEIKNSWHQLAHYLLESFDSSRIQSAYTASAHYDTTYCPPQDWALQSSDAMVDLYTFARELGLRFPQTPVEDRALSVQKQVDAAILARHQENGLPWFGTDAPVWNLDNHRGIGLYADMVGQPYQGQSYLNWQAHFYTTTVSTDNPHPYTFLAVDPGEGNWADILGRIWAETPGLQTAACLPDLPSSPQLGELSVAEVLIPFRGSVTNGSPVIIIPLVTTNHQVIRPTTALTVTLQNQVVFTDVIEARSLVTGTHAILPTHLWYPELPHPQGSELFTLTVVVDPDNRVEESNELDNRLVITDRVWPAPLFPRPLITPTLEGSPQWVSTPSVMMNVEQDPSTLAAPVHTLRVDLYQYEPSSIPFTQRVTYRDSLHFRSLDLPQTIPVELPDTLKPGVTVMMVWGFSAGGGSPWRLQSVIPFNYIPPQSPIAAGENHYFMFSSAIGNSIHLDLDVGNGEDANLFGWDPYNPGSPNPTWGIAIEPGDDAMTIPVRFWDAYIVAVHGVTDAHYTLTVTSSSIMVSHPNAFPTPPPGTYIPARRPILEEPLPRPPFQVYLPLIMR